MKPVTENMSQKQTTAVLRELQYRATPLSGTGAPAASAAFVGQEYQDTSAVSPAGWYKARTVGSGAADWVAIS